MKNKRILIIDDEPDIVFFLKTALADAGFENIFSAGSSKEGLSLLLSMQAPDLICLDLLMPEQTGLSLYKEIMSNPKLNHIPVLIISGMGMKAEIDDLIKQFFHPDQVGENNRQRKESKPTIANGATVCFGYIEKPIEIPLFLETIKKLLFPMPADLPPL